MQIYKNDIEAARAALASGVDVNAPDQESSWCVFSSCARPFSHHHLSASS